MNQIDLTDLGRCEEHSQNVEIVRGHVPTDSRVIRNIPKIGIYEPSHSPSGQSRYIDGILSSIDLKEFEVVIFGHQDGPYQSLGIPIVECSDAPEGTRAQQAGKEGPDPGRGSRRTWRRFIPSTARLWAGYGRNCLCLASTFRNHPVDLLHTNNTGCEESAIAARLAGIPRVLGTFHVDSTYDLHKTRDGFRYRIIEHISNHCLHKAIAVSEATRRDWMRRTHLSGNRVIAISNGVDLQEFRRHGEKEDARAQLGLPNDGRLLLGGVGRLDEAKGFSYLLEAFALLAGEHRDCDLVLAGAGPLRGAARGTCRSVLALPIAFISSASVRMCGRSMRPLTSSCSRRSARPCPMRCSRRWRCACLSSLPQSAVPQRSLCMDRQGSWSRLEIPTPWPTRFGCYCPRPIFGRS